VITGDEGSLCKSELVILSCACYEKQGLIYLMRGLFRIQKYCNYSQGLTFHRGDMTEGISNTNGPGYLTMGVQSAFRTGGGDTKAVSMAAV